MPRRLKSEKPYIVVFCEGKSEQAYRLRQARQFYENYIELTISTRSLL